MFIALWSQIEWGGHCCKEEPGDEHKTSIRSVADVETKRRKGRCRRQRLETWSQAEWILMKQSALLYLLGASCLFCLKPISHLIC